MDHIEPVIWDDITDDTWAHQTQVDEVLPKGLLSIGYHCVDKYTYEPYVEGGSFAKAHYVDCFEDLRALIIEHYPEAKWEKVGWF